MADELQIKMAARIRELYSRLKWYQVTAIFSILFALVGFSYNAWRMGVTEYNSTTRTACFELFIQLSELEQLVFAAHYDQDIEQGNPRKGWVKVGLIRDLSRVTDEALSMHAQQLHNTWSSQWETIRSNRASVDLISKDVDTMRDQLRAMLKNLD